MSMESHKMNRITDIPIDNLANKLLFCAIITKQMEIMARIDVTIQMPKVILSHLMPIILSNVGRSTSNLLSKISSSFCQVTLLFTAAWSQYVVEWIAIPPKKTKANTSFPFIFSILFK